MLVREAINEHGLTYAKEARITLRDKPAPLYQLAVLTSLMAKPISADLAVSGARELFAAGYRTPHRMLAASWQQRVDALGRGHYRRYDESTATILETSATWLLETYRGDLRCMADAAGLDVVRTHELLQEMPGIGPTGASIFLREVQAVWTWVRPYVDEKVIAAAAALQVPHTVRGLTRAAGTDDLSILGAALIRATA